MAAPKYGPCKTMAPENQFTFKCPVFGAATKIAACWQLREIYSKGERPPVRRGCQVAIECGKCPLDVIAWDMIRNSTDPYHATDAAVRNLDHEHLERIAPVLIREEVMRRYELTPAETAKLRQANAEAGPVKRNHSSRPKKTDEVMEEVPTAQAPTPTTTTASPSADVIAATTGDMTAAINAEMEQRKE